MQNQTLLTILVAGSAGILASTAISLSLMPTATEPHESLAATPGGLLDDSNLVSRADLQQELDRMRVSNQTLSNRIAELEQARVWAESRREVVVPKAELQAGATEADLQKALAARMSSDGTLPPEVEEGVKRAFEEFRDQEREEAEQRWEDARQAELEARIKRYTTELNLDDFQAKEMLTLLGNEQVRRGEMMDAARDGEANWETLREDMRTLRDETRDGLALVLTPEQLEKYEASSRNRFGGGRGGFGGGGPDREDGGPRGQRGNR